MSLTLTLSGKSTVLTANYFPAIDLSDDDYELGLVIFETYHRIPNVKIIRTTNFILPKMTWKLQFPKVRTKCET